MPGAYLPPVVTRLAMNLDGFAASVAEAKAMIKGLGGDAQVEINADLNQASVGRALTAVTSITDSFNGANVRIGAEINEASILAALAEIKTAVSAINAVGRPVAVSACSAGLTLTPCTGSWQVAPRFLL